MATPLQSEPQHLPTAVELRAMELSRWLQHKHDGTSMNIKKDLMEAGLRERDRLFIWTDGSTFTNTKALCLHILSTAPELINDLHNASLAMQKILKAGYARPPKEETKPKHAADPSEPLNREGRKRKKAPLGTPPTPAPALAPDPAPAFNSIPGVPEFQGHAAWGLSGDEAEEPAAAAHAPPQAHHVEPTLPVKLATKLVSGEFKAERKATRQAIAAVLSEPASSPSDLHLPALKHLVQHHRVHPALQAKAGVLLEDYERALEVGAARTLSGLQGAGAGLGGGAAAAPRSDDDLRQDIEALSELLASNNKFTPLALAGLEQQKAALEEELVQRGEQVKNEADFKLQRLSLMEEVKELLEAEDKNLGEVIKTAVELRKLFEYL